MEKYKNNKNYVHHRDLGNQKPEKITQNKTEYPQKNLWFKIAEEKNQRLNYNYIYHKS